MNISCVWTFYWLNYFKMLLRKHVQKHFIRMFQNECGNILSEVIIINNQPDGTVLSPKPLIWIEDVFKRVFECPKIGHSQIKYWQTWNSTISCLHKHGTPTQYNHGIRKHLFPNIVGTQYIYVKSVELSSIGCHRTFTITWMKIL